MVNENVLVIQWKGWYRLPWRLVHTVNGRAETPDSYMKHTSLRRDKNFKLYKK